MKSLAASREVSTPSSNPQICNLLCAASGGELDPEGLRLAAVTTEQVLIELETYVSILRCFAGVLYCEVLGQRPRELCYPDQLGVYLHKRR